MGFEPTDIKGQVTLFNLIPLSSTAAPNRVKLCIKYWYNINKILPKWAIQVYRINFISANAQRVEKVSLQHIQELIHRVEEALGLLKVLVDHQFHTLAATLSKVGNAFIYSDIF